MDLRPLGRSGIEVPPLAFGGNVFGWTADEDMSFRLLDRLFDAGFNFIDTADVYSAWVDGHEGGESERVIGRWMTARGNRKEVIVATKAGMGRDARNLAGDYLLHCAERSLERLETDYIDLYQSHQDDEDTPQEETLSAYAELMEAGKVRAIGASNFSAARLESALETSAREGLPRYETLQPEYNLYARDGYEGALEAVCRKEGLGVIPYFALAAGFLTGKYRSEADFSKSARGKSMAKYLNPRGKRILAALDGVAARHDASPAQIAIAWLIARPSVTAPIASATNLDQLDELIAATKIALGEEDLATLDQASAP